MVKVLLWLVITICTPMQDFSRNQISVSRFRFSSDGVAGYELRVTGFADT